MMDDFATVFLRPLLPSISVACFVGIGLVGERWAYAVAAGLACYFVALEVQRASGWGRR
jgi:hypothetical protein